jgi:glucokinase
MILAGDVGGTKTALALFDLGVDARPPVREATLPSRDRTRAARSSATSPAW